MTEKALRDLVVFTAAKYMGAKEGSGGHLEIVSLYNSHKPRPRGYAMKMADAWCAAFVSAIAIRLNLTEIIPVECSCSKMIELFKANGRWQEADSYIPKTGDVIFYDWQDSGAGDNTGAPDHVGYVDHVADGTIFVTEGNYRDAVGTREIRVNARYIRGYGLPDYASMADDKSVDELAREVIAGKWGNGQERKDRLTANGYNVAAVQDRVNELLGHTYTVQKGDTLWGIAEKKLGMGRRFLEIKELNGLTDNTIYPGQILKMPEQ